jgi:hypothetical protein
MRKIVWVLLVVLFAITSAIQTGCDDDDMTTNEVDCEPKTTRSCTCNGGGEGRQTCRSNGTWGVCVGCAPSSGDGDSDSDTNSDADSDTDLDIDSDTDSEGGTDSTGDTDTESASDSDTGTGYDCNDPQDLETCLNCSCMDESLTCFGNPDCLNLIYCLQMCEEATDACLNDCIEIYSEGAIDFLAIVTCSDENCSDFYDE